VKPKEIPLQSPADITPEKMEYHAQILSNRIRTRFRHFSRKYRKQHIDCFRLYDWDIPEVRAVVDWYAGRLVIGEYERTQTGLEWLPRMASAVAQVLDVVPENVHLRRRRTGKTDEPRYSRLASRGDRFIVQERDLRFWVNMNDFLDTGLFSDHRDTRLLVRDQVMGKRFLNLYAYTGSFTCAAVAGGATSSVSVDRSKTYLDWASDNFVLNNVSGDHHRLMRSDAMVYLESAARQGCRFDVAVVDPPSFFQDEQRGVKFDIQRNHPALLRAVLKVMEPGGLVFFSTNRQYFEPRMDGLIIQGIKELTPKTIPEDYRNKLIHRCWKMIV
jgi:23S rRNA (cytosine1962-C5)-methyltransferase